MLLASLKLFSDWNSSETYPYFSIMHERKVDDDVKSLTINAMPGFTMTWKYTTTTGRVKPGAIFKNHQNVFKIEKRKQFHRKNTNYIDTCNAMQAVIFVKLRLRQISARDGPQGGRPQSLKPCLELTLNLVVTHPPTTQPKV